jgi:hypothetical protein
MQCDERFGAVSEIIGAGVLLDTAQHGGCGVRAHVRTSSLAVMRQPLAALLILRADCGIKKFEVLRGVFDERSEHLAHQFLIIKSDVPKLLQVQNQVGIYRVHIYIFGRRTGSQDGTKHLTRIADSP